LEEPVSAFGFSMQTYEDCIKYILILFVCIVVCTGLIVLEQKRLVIRQQTLRLLSLPDAFDGVRMVQLSDLHKRVYPHG